MASSNSPTQPGDHKKTLRLASRPVVPNIVLLMQNAGYERNGVRHIVRDGVCYVPNSSGLDPCTSGCAPAGLRKGDRTSVVRAEGGPMRKLPRIRLCASVLVLVLGSCTTSDDEVATTAATMGPTTTTDPTTTVAHEPLCEPGPFDETTELDQSELKLAALAEGAALAG